MQYLQIKDWDKMQHYKKRNPPWIKLYAEILEDEDFECMTDTSKLVYFCLMPFASRKDNKVKNNLKWLNKKLPLDAEIEPKHIQELIDNGFIEDASNVLAVRTHLAIPETEKRQSKEETKTEFPSNLDTPDFHKAWKEWIQFRAEIKKKLTPSTIAMQLKKLSTVSVNTAIQIIETSIQNGWQGLFMDDIKEQPVAVDPEKVSREQWYRQCGDWLKQATKEAIEAHGEFLQRLREPKFRAWAEFINPIVKEIK